MNESWNAQNNHSTIDYNPHQNHVPNNFVPRPHRQWVRTQYGGHHRYDNSEYTFVLMSYNILAQSLLERHSYLYEACVPQFLDWSHRLNCIRSEILAIRPVILCLQEVQETHLAMIEEALRPMNYAKPLFKKRTSSIYDDGCAIFYNPDYFELLDHHYVEYYQPNVRVSDRFFGSMFIVSI